MVAHQTVRISYRTQAVRTLGARAAEGQGRSLEGEARACSRKAASAPLSMVTLMQKVAALRAVFGIAADVALPTAVNTMNTLMGIDGNGALPEQVEILSCAALRAPHAVRRTHQS